MKVYFFSENFRLSRFMHAHKNRLAHLKIVQVIWSGNPYLLIYSKAK